MYLMYPQAYLLHYAAFSTPQSGPKETENPLPLLDTNLKICRFEEGKDVKLAKLKGSYYPEAVMSAVLSSKKDTESISKFFLNMENHKISSLVPEVRLYRVSNDDGSVKPFYFPIVSDYKYLAAGNVMDLSNSFTSNASVIESFSVTITGKNPFQKTRAHLEANLKIKLDNVATIFDTPGSDYAPLADLFTIRNNRDHKPAGTNKSSAGNALETGKGCKIVATMGYAPPVGGIFSSKEKKIIKSMSQTIHLFYAGHDLSMEQNGAASLSVKYTGFFSAVKGESQYNLISNTATKARLIKAKIGKTSNLSKELISTFMSKKDKEEKETKEKAETTSIDEVPSPSPRDTMGSFGEMIDILYENNKVHVLSQFDASLRAESLIGTSGILEDISLDSIIGEGTDAALNAAQGLAAKKPIPTLRPTHKQVSESGANPFEFLYNNYIFYVTLGDLLDAYYIKISTDLARVRKSISKDNRLSDDSKKKCITRLQEMTRELKRLNVLMADCVYTRKKEADTSTPMRVINIADIPISIDTIYTLVYEDITSINKSYYDMNDFITSFIPKLLTRSFGELPSSDFLNEITFTTTTYTSKPLNRSDIEDYKLSIDDLPSPMQISSVTQSEKLEQYIIIHQEPSSHTKTIGTGDEELDTLNGIYHLRANQNSGVIKNITFQKIPNPTRQTYMIVVNGKAYDEIRFAHNAELDMVGNNLFYPGVMAYINPESLGFGDPRGQNSAARSLGFGGYYNTGPVTTTFSGGSLSTKVTLYFESFPSSDAQEKEEAFGRKKKKRKSRR